VNIIAPVQKRIPPFPYHPATSTRKNVIKWIKIEMASAFFLPVAEGSE
jgi:hypothetical protein